MLISDLDTSNASRTALLASSTTQGGVSSFENDTFGNVIVAVLDSDFNGDDDLECDEGPENAVEPDTAAKLIAAGTLAIATALMI